MGAIPKLQDFDDPSFDPFATDETVMGDFEDVYTPIAAIRRRTPVFEGCFSDVIGHTEFGSLAKPGQREFVILGYEELIAAASDPQTFSSAAGNEGLKATLGNILTVMDPPVHGRYRRIFQAAFLPRTISEWGSDIIIPVITRLIDAFTTRGRADLVDEFTRYFAFHVIYRQLTLPENEARIFHKLAVAQVLFGGGGGTYMRHAIEATQKLGRYFQAMIDYRRKTPGKDLVSVLACAEVDGERLPDDVVISFLRQLIIAGGDTTFRETSNLLAGLLMNPDQLEAVRNDCSLVPQAIEEAMRWEAPLSIVPRETVRDVTLGGVFIPAGSYVDLFFGAASRDETIFPEPHKFNIFRPKARHFGFGFGPHLCIGQHLARMEMTTALNAILDRLPNLRLDPETPRPIIRGRANRYPKHLHVVFG